MQPHGKRGAVSAEVNRCCLQLRVAHEASSGALRVLPAARAERCLLSLVCAQRRIGARRPLQQLEDLPRLFAVESQLGLSLEDLLRLAKGRLYEELTLRPEGALPQATDWASSSSSTEASIRSNSRTCPEETSPLAKRCSTNLASSRQVRPLR